MNTDTAIPAVINDDYLVKAAGANLASPQVIFTAPEFNGTAGFRRDPMGSIQAYEKAVYSEYEKTTLSETYGEYTEDQVRVAMAHVLSLREEGKSQSVSNDPTVNPQTKRIAMGYDWNTGDMAYMVVPAYCASLPGFGSIDPKWQPVMYLSTSSSGPTLQADVLRMDQDKVNGIFKTVRKYMDSNPMYLGQVVDVQFNFVDLTTFKIENVAFTDTLRSKIDLFVRGPLRYTSALDEENMPRKTGLFLHGPAGGGKTMTMTACEVIAARSGAIVVRVDPASGIHGFAHAEKMTKVMMENGHKVLFSMEDMEKLAGQAREKVLDILDGASSKGFRRITVGTTNFIEVIDRAMLRPGRFDAVEFCGLPDRSAFEQLVRVLLPGRDLTQVSFDEAFPAFEGYSYAFMANATQSVIRAAVNRLKGDMDDFVLHTQDLIDSANAVRGHFDLMQEEVVKPKLSLDKAFHDAQYEAIEEYLANNQVSTSDYTDYDYISSLVHDQVDSVVEGRMHESTIEDGDGNESHLKTN